ncbi:MAG: hypothetical protein M4579_002637 [Chaenotheca gracillima]|nr:MAG: hypothetical protein M4579_002637 [Chaenotheca gracillima]
MTVLWIVGTRLHDSLNRADFLNIYITGGVVGTLTNLTVNVLRNNLIPCSLGASGGVCAALGAWLWMNLQSVTSSAPIPNINLPQTEWVPANAGLPH